VIRKAQMTARDEWIVWWGECTSTDADPAETGARSAGNGGGVHL